MLQINELQGMTVVQLRKIAREHGVKLSAGIDKEGIVARVSAALAASEGLQKEPSEAAVPKVQELQATPLSADVTSVAPRTGGTSAWQARQAQNAKSAAPVYRQAWQARTPASRQSAQRPAWGQPQRPASAPSRFGPQVNYVQNPTTIPEIRQEEALRGEARPETSLKLDGYKLGYRAAPQRPVYQRNDGYRPHRSEMGMPRPQYQQPAPYTPVLSASQEVYFNDALYKPVRDEAFGEPYASGKPLPDMLVAGEGEWVSGVLEILPDGYGFLRAEGLTPGKTDTYVSAAQIRRFGLRSGDLVEGHARARVERDKFAALLYVEKRNGHEPDVKENRQTFDSLTPIYPTQRIVLESEKNSGNMPVRLVDLIAPIGFGQRAMIIAPPNSGQLDMLREIGCAIKENDPQAHLMMLLVDTAPEEATELKEALDAEVFAATFAEPPEAQTRISETMLEGAQRLVEDGRNVVILLDSLTKLTRIYQAALTQGGRAMTNTVTPAALVKPKRFFGMARNTKEGGSLTIVATIAIETGSRVDDIIFEEFKGTANMELRLCVPGINDPIFPLIDLQRSATRKEDMLLGNEEKESLRAIRTMLGASGNQEAIAQLIEMMEKTKCNADLFNRLKDWVVLWEKSGLLVKKN